MSYSIAIPIRGGDDFSSLFDNRFGRAKGFLLCDEDGAFEVIDNPGAKASHGAGINAAALMHEKGIKRVVAAEFGPKASESLSAYGVAMFRTGALEATAKEIVDRLLKGAIEEFSP